jgi:hypothetical protein
MKQPMTGRRSDLALLLSLLVVGGCRSTGEEATSLRVTRDTLQSGVVRVRYGGLPDSDATTVAVDLSIGALDGDPEFVFGDVRGVEVDAEGTIYVLDYQASEIRTFDATGAHLATLGGKGEGPGEIGEANGMILVGDSLLWIQDHAQWQMLAFARDGTEVERVPMHVRSYAYIWNGTVDDGGVFWKPVSHSDQTPGTPPGAGFGESQSRTYLVSFDPATESRDSIFLGIDTYRYFVTRSGRRGFSFQQVPFQPRGVTVVDPQGGFWRSDAEEYELVRLDGAGDTTMVVQADISPPAVTEQEREEFRAGMVERDETLARAAAELTAAMPDTKPAISGLMMDDEGRLWVRRGGTERGLPVYDIFSRSGDYEGSVRLNFTPAPYLPLRIRSGRIYALVPDDLGVPYVVRGATLR